MGGGSGHVMIGVTRHASGIVQAFQAGQPGESDPAIQYQGQSFKSAPAHASVSNETILISATVLSYGKQSVSYQEVSCKTSNSWDSLQQLTSRMTRVRSMDEERVLVATPLDR